MVKAGAIAAAGRERHVKISELNLNEECSNARHEAEIPG
jgi:hypothetical protein